MGELVVAQHFASKVAHSLSGNGIVIRLWTVPWHPETAKNRYLVVNRAWTVCPKAMSADGRALCVILHATTLTWPTPNS